MNNGYHGQHAAQPPTLGGGLGSQPGVKIPPAVPPRTRDSSMTRDPAGVTRAQYQTLTSLTNGMATIKRTSLGRAEGQMLLEEVFRASTLSRRGGGGGGADGRVPFRREASVPRTGVPNWSDDQRQHQQPGGGGSAANWSDSLPRKDLFLNQTNSLPRRDKAGLGRPEPNKPSSLVKDSAAKDKRDVSLERSNPFRDAILGGRFYFKLFLNFHQVFPPQYCLIRLNVLACNKTMRCINFWHFSI